MVSKKKNFQFEDSLSKLEKLVEEMEDGEFSLEDSLKAFEEGIKLTRECQQALKPVPGRGTKKCGEISRVARGVATNMAFNRCIPPRSGY